jgi:site-specific recombinase
MKPLNIALSSLAAVVALTGLPVLAHAQSAGEYGVDASADLSDHAAFKLQQREDWLAAHMHDALNDAAIDHDQYRHLRNDLDGVRDTITTLRTRQDGVLTEGQVARLQDRLDDIGHRLRSLSQADYPYPW